MSIVKISFESTTKRVKLSVASFAELKETVSKLFPQLAGSNEFFIQYPDEVGDIVTVSDDDDVSLMVSDPNLAKTKIIVSRVLMTNSEVSKQMKESVAIPSQMEPVKQESPISNANPQEAANQIGVYPTLAKEDESAKAESTKTEAEMTKVEETPSAEKTGRPGKRGGSRPKKELSEKQRKLIKLARKIVNNKDVASKKKEKFLKLLSNCVPNVLNSRPGKRLLILKAKAALDTILTESELDEIKQLTQKQQEKKQRKEKETSKEPESPEKKALRKRVKHLKKSTPEEVEKVQKEVMTQLETEPTLFQNKKKARLAVLEIKKAKMGLTAQEETELTALKELREKKKAMKAQRRPRSRSHSKGRCGSKGKCGSKGLKGMNQERARNAMKIMAKAISQSVSRSISRGSRKGERGMRGQNRKNVKYPKMVEKLRKLLVKGKELKPKAQARISEIVSTDPEAFRDMPRLRVLALKVKKANGGLTPDQEVELTKNESILQRPSSGGLRRGSKGGRSVSRERRHPMKGNRHLAKEAKMNQMIDQRIKTLMPDIAASVQKSIATGQPVTGLQNANKAPVQPAPKKASLSPQRLAKVQVPEKKVVKINEDSQKPKVVKKEAEDCPEWLKPKRDQLVSIFGISPQKAQQFLIANKFRPIEEIIENLLCSEEELKRLM